MISNLNGKTILIVDDEADLREVLVREFKRNGCNILEAGSGNEALEKIKQSKVDAVVTDIRMPNGSGIELLDKIKEQNPVTPIVLLITGYSDVEESVAHDKGAEGMFAKPFDRKALIHTLERALMPSSQRWQRKTERIISDLHIELKFENRETAVKGRLLNVGRGGLFVHLEEADIPKKGSIASFIIHFKEGNLQLIEGEGIVRWSRYGSPENYPSGCGIEFLQLSDQSKDQVINLIDHLKSKAFIPLT